jgi:hypothetical protein
MEGGKNFLRKERVFIEGCCVDPHPHHFGKLDPDPHQSKKRRTRIQALLKFRSCVPSSKIPFKSRSEPRLLKFQPFQFSQPQVKAVFLFCFFCVNLMNFVAGGAKRFGTRR